MTIDQFLKAKALKVEEQLDKLLPLQQVPYKQLFEAARYSLLGGGKRLRPILTLATCEAFGGDEKAALVPACALEMVHTYSMIHDDLPCMDNDDFRRGKPSLHKAFPESQAVLAGDYLLTYAFDILSSAPHLTPQQIINLISTLAKKAGGEGMSAGQVMDIEASNQKVSLEALNHIHAYKTGALIATAVEFGAIVAGATVEQRHTLTLFANEVGLAFQIVDDILDVTAGEQKRGQTAASDVTNGKTTYVTLLGIEKSQEASEKLLQSALAKLDQLSLKTDHLAVIARLLVHRHK
jgi:geranylgeranyl diphosphate synthase type II